MSDEQRRLSDSARPESLEELLAAVREIERLLHELLRLLERGRDAAPAPPAAARAPVAGRGPRSAPPPEAPDGSDWRRCLTPRENEILGLLLTGVSNRAISRRLGITERTVKNNLHTVYRKLGVTGRAETIARFLPTTSDPGPPEPPAPRPGGPPPGPGGPPEPPGAHR
ncbi:MULTISPECIES: helix-turn-helix domain-containing protein [Streptomyces]|uniref:helix-turn-helix domain-containing protein n=1 Tax=Streptomyces TaxID=1883 RepID=UPI00224935C2|nr:helix-turn-helix transcriptional regulator [Streptomyces sp. JHD 1]MCX2969807.1 helix-turn-helix transcriptional regulator [Streptomyces sp. JHD 1]